MDKVTEMLAVPGARLYTERRGTGPLLVCIVGGNGDAEAFGRLGALLARQFTVVAYDRRGFARSPLDGPIDDAARIAIDADDAVRVIERHGGPAYVIGSSSGAIVGLDLLARAPGSVRLLVAHEPPLVTLLPDAAHWLAMFDRVHATYLASGVEVAMEEFGAAVGMPMVRPQAAPLMPLPPEIAEMLGRMPANQAFWLAHELRTYPRFAPDVAALRAAAGRLVFAVGREPPEAPLTRPARALARSVGAPIVELAGGHVGYVTHAAEFAAGLTALLSAPR
jgi:pimeloyl-ACP methyl ester carboxylesterase